MSDREKKIAEIRERYGRRNESGQRFAIFQGHAAEDIDFLFSELDREREENRKLRERLKEELIWQDECLKLEEQLQSAQQERDKLIGALRWYADTKNYEYRTSYLDQDAPIIDDSGQRARDILKEMEVAVEWQKSVNDMRTIR